MERKIIFIDFDGVLHPPQFLQFQEKEGELVLTGDQRFCWSDYLWECVRESDCEIVVHSSWRHGQTLDDIRALLPAKLARRVSGITRGEDRYAGILDYVRETKVSAYLILDDAEAEFPECCPELIVCDPTQGLSDPWVCNRVTDFIDRDASKQISLVELLQDEAILTENITRQRFMAADIPTLEALVTFNEISKAVPTGPGIYQIWTMTGIALKVGISSDLRRRLRTHRASPLSRSVLARHLNRDRTLAPNHDLTTDVGRQRFLADECRIAFISTSSRRDARNLEIRLERTGKFRYIGKVRER